jgi:hypothetical protein
MANFPDNLFHAVGQIVIYWSMVEDSMHNCIITIYHKYRAKNNIKNIKILKRIPISLDNKIAFWEISFKELPVLFPFKITGISLFKQICNLREERHNIIHGVFTGKHGEFFRFAKLNLNETDFITFNLLERTIEHLDQTGKKMQILAKNLQNFSYQLLERFG